jgi:AraC-like DNA-binding protein
METLEDACRQKLLDILNRPSEWKVLSNLFPPDMPPIEHSDAARLIRRSFDHIHGHRQIIIILGGEELVVLDEKLYLCKPGTMVFVDPLQPHCTRPVDPAKPSTFCRINLWQESVHIRTWFRREDSPDVGLDREVVFHDDTLDFSLERHWIDISNNLSLSASLRRLKLLHATVFTLVLTEEKKALTTTGRALSRDNLIDQLVEHLKETGGRGATLKSLAQTADYSLCQFARLFKKRTGCTVHEFIDTCRITKARELRAQGFNQKQIAEALGFSDQPAYSHWRSRTEREGVKL